MLLTTEDFKNLKDYRGYEDHYTPEEWRKFLRTSLLIERGFRSDLSGKLLRSADLHEGIIPKYIVPKSVSWGHLIFSGVNCFILSRAEHQPFPPSREVCYEISCRRYGKELVDAWIDSLPFKVPIEIPGRF